MLLLVAGLIIPFSLDSVFATHQYDDEVPLEDGRERLRYYMIFASHEKQCSNYDEFKQSFLRSVTNQVLREYNFQTTSRMECVEVIGNMEYDGGNTSNTFGLTLDNALKKAKDWHFDLLIVIFDEELSRQYYREMYEAGRPAAGHARFYGDFKQIVLTTSPPSQYSEWITEHLPPLRNLQEIEEERGAWILSHELAHFALEYLGYPFADSVDYVHETQKEYDNCQYFGFRQDFCFELFFEIKRLDVRGNEFWIKVMEPPYEDIKRWMDLPAESYDYTTVPTSISINTSRTTTEVGDTMWINGKVTTPISNNLVYLKIFDPYGRVVVDEKLRVNQYSEYRFSFKTDNSLMPISGTYTVKVNYRGLEQTAHFTHSIPSEITQSTTVNPSISSVSISTDKSSYNGPQRVNIFGEARNYDSGDPYPTVILRDPFGIEVERFGVIMDETGKFRTSSAYFTIINPNAASGTYSLTIENLNVVDKAYFSYTAPYQQPTPVTPKQPTPVTPQQPKITKSDFDGDGIPDDDDMCRTQAEVYNGYIDWDGCPDTETGQIKVTLDNDNDGVLNHLDQCPGMKETVNGFKDEDGCPDAILTSQKSSETTSDSWTLEKSRQKIDESSQYEQKAKQSEKEKLILIKKNTLKEIKELESKALSLEQTLTGIVYKNKDAQEKINEAWTGLRIIKQDLDFMNNQINRGNNARQGSSIDLIETYLEKIPKLIEDAKAIDPEKPKFCFFWWCW